MNTVVLKFGGSSVSDNINLNIVAQKIIEFKEKEKNVVCVVSAQGKTTDNLIKEAKELSSVPVEREMDSLLSTGEQISASKLAILLERLGYNAISLNGWQAGIYTNDDHQNAKIIEIDTKRIEKELESGRIVIITGFQGVDKNLDITTLGRGGSDTSAVAIAAALKAKHCYIFSDVDGIYTADPKQVKLAHKLNSISYEEMSYISGEGAKVLHDRCVELAEKYNMPIIAASTFNSNKGTEVSTNMEETIIKSIIKNDNILYIQIENINSPYQFINKLIENNIKIGKYTIKGKSTQFTINKVDRNKFEKLVDNEEYTICITAVSKISIVGSGISNHFEILNDVLNTFITIQNDIIEIDNSNCKLSITFNKIIETKYLNDLHDKFIKL